MIIALLLAMLLPPSFADSVQALYGRNDVQQLATLCDEAAETRTEQLLCRYRLYPLTEDKHYVDDLPDARDDATAQEMALLAGLWGYRASRGSMLQTIRAGRRAAAMLEGARSIDPDEPYLLLVEGQSLLFRPALFGGDDQAALALFQRLRAQMDEAAPPGISPVEVDVWIWYAMKEMGHPEAETVRETLLQQDVPPLYREMLTSMS